VSVTAERDGRVTRKPPKEGGELSPKEHARKTESGTRGTLEGLETTEKKIKVDDGTKAKTRVRKSAERSSRQEVKHCKTARRKLNFPMGKVEIRREGRAGVRRLGSGKATLTASREKKNCSRKRER